MSKEVVNNSGLIVPEKGQSIQDWQEKNGSALDDFSTAKVPAKPAIVKTRKNFGFSLVSGGGKHFVTGGQLAVLHEKTTIFIDEKGKPAATGSTFQKMVLPDSLTRREGALE